LFKGLREIATSRLPIFGTGDNEFHLPATTLILIIIAIAAAIFLNKTIYGRYLLALGNNPDAARYSGINVDRRRAGPPHRHGPPRSGTTRGPVNHIEGATANLLAVHPCVTLAACPIKTSPIASKSAITMTQAIVMN
jgi:hypothetical protein